MAVTPTLTSSASASASSAAAKTLTASSHLKIVGIILAIASGCLIGSSFVFKKKGLQRSQQAAGEGVAYLKSPLWWLGMIMMITGEICNFGAYAFVEAIVVTPLGALSVVISAILSSIFLNEKLSFFGWLGCALCIIGSIVIALNGPQEASVGEIKAFQALFLSPGFLVWAGALIVASLVIIFVFAPKHGKKSMLWYISVCSMIGGISVSVTTGLGAAIVTTALGENQFKYWFIYFLLVFVVVTLLTEVYYLNMALALFNTAMVTPTYYVIFTFFSISTTVILFKGLSASASQIITIVMAFLVICIGITILQMSKVDPTQLTKLDRRSTILLQAARRNTAAVDEKDVIGVEDPGMDALRGSFGAVGSIIRARSARRMSMSRGGGAAGAGGTRMRREYETSPWMPNQVSPSTDGIDGLKRHQLYDAPMPQIMSPKQENSSLAVPGRDDLPLTPRTPGTSQLTAKRTTIKFDSRDMVHSYHAPGSAHGSDPATHEHRDAAGRVDGIPYPPSPLVNRGLEPSSPAGTLISTEPEPPSSPTETPMRQAQTIAIPAPFMQSASEVVHSAPPTVNPRYASRYSSAGATVGSRTDSRDLFDSQVNLLGGTSFSSSSSSNLNLSLGLGFSGQGGLSDAGAVEDERSDTASGRGRKAKRYPRTAGEDDREESVSLWQRRGSDEDSMEDGAVDASGSTSATLGVDSPPVGGIRLVQQPRRGMF